MKLTKLHLIALTFLLIPTGFLLLFTLGEVFSGELSGLSHLLQLAPLIFLGWLALKKPLLADVLLLTISLLLGAFYYLDNQFPWQTVALVELLLFLPSLLSGILLIREGLKQRESNFVI